MMLVQNKVFFPFHCTASCVFQVSKSTGDKCSSVFSYSAEPKIKVEPGPAKGPFSAQS